MEWEPAAVEQFIELPLTDAIKANARIFTEKMARQTGGERVTAAALEQARCVYFAKVPEAVRRREYELRVAAGETDLPERMARAARAILAAAGELYQINTCRAGYSYCTSQIFSLKGLKEEVVALFERVNFTARRADKLRDDAMILAHHRFTVGLSGCINGCATPEAKCFGVSGTARPRVTEASCSECFACVDTCKRGAVLIRDGRPVINVNLCDACGQCVKACPDGTLEFDEKGYKVFVGGRLGRFHQPAYELFKLVDQETVLRALEATLETYLTDARGDEHISALLNRIGLAPIYRRIYQP